MLEWLLQKMGAHDAAVLYSEMEGMVSSQNEKLSNQRIVISKPETNSLAFFSNKVITMWI